MVSYLLDTNICIALLTGKDKTLVSKVQSCTPDQFYLCSVVKAELLYGARYSQRVEENLSLLNTFFAQFMSFAFDDPASEFYGILRALLNKAGTPIGANDLFIASIAQAHDLTVLTRNRKEFSQVPGLRIESW